MIDDYANQNENAVAFESLGMLRYLSALKYAQMVIGNSSSGLIEVPSLHIPTINIGDRQKGRIQGATIINCGPEKDAILQAMNQANDPGFRESIQDAVNPYGNGKTSDKIIEVITDFLMNDRIDLKKQFYDIEVSNV